MLMDFLQFQPAAYEHPFANQVSAVAVAFGLYGLLRFIWAITVHRRDKEWIARIRLQFGHLAAITLFGGLLGFSVCLKKVLHDIPAKGMVDAESIALAFEWALKPLHATFAVVLGFTVFYAILGSLGQD